MTDDPRIAAAEAVRRARRLSLIAAEHYAIGDELIREAGRIIGDAEAILSGNLVRATKPSSAPAGSSHRPASALTLH